jgi:DHA2 family methylenomycin A resistance protein-like MFS transporter
MPLIAICLGYFMVILDATAVTVALPDLARDLGGGVSGLQWVVDGYTLVFAGMLLSAGSLGDRLGGRRVFQAGLLLFTLASAACAAAPSVTLLVVARLAQGLGAALLVPSSLALLRAAYHDPRERARAVGVWGAVAGIAAASGPVIGGLVVAASSWRAVFLLNLPVGVAALLLARHHLPRSGERAGGALDPAGQITGIAALTSLTLGLIEGGRAGWSSPAALVPLLLSLPFAAAFVACEHRAREPMLPLRLFRSPTFSGASFVGLAINLGFYGQLFVMSLYFQHVRGWSALATGLAFLPEGIFVALSSALSGRVMGRVGPRVPMLAGLLLGGTGLAGLTVAGNATSYPLLVPPLIAAGFGMAFTMPAATNAIIGAAPAERAGIASGVLNASRQAGGAIGVALLGTLVGSGAFIPGLRVAMLVAGAAFFLAAAVAALTVERPAPPDRVSRRLAHRHVHQRRHRSARHAHRDAAR